MAFTKIAFFLLIVCYFVSAKSITKFKGKYIGSFVSKKNHAVLSEYFLLQESGNWNKAKKLCEDQGASLVSVETIDEIKALNEILDEYGIDTYWTSGRYSGLHKSWVWTPNDVAFPIPSNLPWNDGHPKTPNALYRIALRYEFLQTKFQTIVEASRANIICEVSHTDSAMPCQRANDINFVLDASSNMSEAEFEAVKSFFVKLSKAFTTHSTTRSAYSRFIEDRAATTVLGWHLPSFIESVILESNYRAGPTETYLIIDASNKILIPNRRNVPQIMVVLTSGHSIDFDRTVQESRKANSNGIRTFAIGVGNNLNHTELLEIGGNKEDHVFTVPTFDDLMNFLYPISVTLCHS